MNRYKELSQYHKQFDIITNWIYYPIATFFCSLLSYTSISPNSITFLAISFELIAFYLILTNFTQLAIIIVLLLQFGWIFDLMDGMMARFKKMGYYHPTEPSNKGYYLDAVSDHILKFMIIAALGYELSKNHEFGWEIGMLALVIHAITQTEHTLRSLIKKGSSQLENKNNNFSTHIALAMNNIYLFYLIFIPINRIDLLLIFFATFEILLLLKRATFFWINEP
jgi:phosphatidylglycerophosphate synthase